ncbi:MAG: ribonuclease P protein component [Betaproteobacteria bacterium]|nr:ribonuclease P protein component [Betaproteobacteria bacterium]
MQNTQGKRLPRAARVRKTDEFSSVFAFRCRTSGAFFQVFAKPNGGQGPRLGLVVSRRVDRRAVRRNRMKRVLRELFRKVRPTLPSLDWVVRVHTGFVDIASDRVEGELMRQFGVLTRKCHAGLSS